MKGNNSLKEIINFRIDKLKKIKKSEVHSFSYKFKQNCKIKDILKNDKKWIDKKVKICGRIVSLRKMGKASFIHIQGGKNKIQLYVKTDNLPQDTYDDIVRI